MALDGNLRFAELPGQVWCASLTATVLLSEAPSITDVDAERNEAHNPPMGATSQFALRNHARIQIIAGERL